MSVRKTPFEHFGKETNKFYTKVWHPFKTISKKEEKQYTEKLENICAEIICRMREIEETETNDYDGSYITTVNGIKLTIEGVNSYEFIRDYYDILYCDVMDNLVDKKFRTACGPQFLHFLENIDYQGRWSDNDSVVKENDVVIDVGGGYGVFALWALKLKAKTVYVFEPNKSARDIIIQNRELNGYTKEQMPIFPFAMSDKKGNGYLYTEEGQPQSGKLTYVEADDPLYKTNNLERVSINTIDEFIHKLESANREKAKLTKQYVAPVINFIKINTNGKEHLVLKGVNTYLNSTNVNLADFAINSRDAVEEYKLCKGIIESANGNYRFYRRYSKTHAIYDDYSE